MTQNGNTYTISLRQSEYAQAPADRLRGVLVAPEGTSWDQEGEVRADWTNRDPEITKTLRSHGRSGGVYVLYEGDGSEPTLLPDVLTQEAALEALKKLPMSPSDS